MFTKQKRMTLVDCYDAAANKELFNSNNISTVQTHNSYTIIHYSTPIGAFINDRWYRNKTKYSNTSSRVVNGIFDAIKEDTIDVVEGDLKTLIDGGRL